jgi:hypothetical protein
MPKIMLDKERDLHLTFSVVRKFKDKFKRNLMSEGISKLNDWTIEEYEELMFLLLELSEPGITKEQVEAICDYPTIAKVIISVFTGETPKGAVIEADPLANGGPGVKSTQT